MNEPNTLQHYLNQIEDEEIRAKAFKNTRKAALSFCVCSVSDALGNAFTWKNTEEGQEFWESVYDKFEAEERGE